jgi:hypothetical protein
MFFVFVVVVVVLVQDTIFGDDYSFLFDFRPNYGRRQNVILNIHFR